MYNYYSTLLCSTTCSHNITKRRALHDKHGAIISYSANKNAMATETFTLSTLLQHLQGSKLIERAHISWHSSA